MAERNPGTDSPVLLLAIAGASAVFLVAVATRWVDLHFLVGPRLFHHWIAWGGALFLAVFTPVFYVLKRRKGKTRDTVIQVHVYGGVLSAVLIGVHFTQHLTRPAEFYPDIGTGVVLAAAMVLSVATGYLLRFAWLKGGMREWRALHMGAAVTFYLAIGIHIAAGIGLA